MVKYSIPHDRGFHENQLQNKHDISYVLKVP